MKTQTLLALALSAAFVSPVFAQAAPPQAAVLAASAPGKGAVAGMLSGLGVTLYYMLSHTALAQALFPKAWLADGMWWDIQPVSAAVFGVPVGLVVAIVVSYWKKT